MRNQNGFGSVVKLSGNRRKPYSVRLTLGWKDGKQVRKYLGYYTTQAEALVALAEYHKNGVDLDLTKLTLDDVYQRWIKRVEGKNLTPTVVKNHQMAHKKLGKLANQPIKKIKTEHLQTWLDNLELKPGTKGKIRSTLVQIFEYATTNDIISKNYARFVEINEKIEKTGSIFTPEEIKPLWNMLDRIEARCTIIMIYTGLRIGELLDIKRENINFKEQYMIGGSKTEAGKNRVIPIHDDLLNLIKEQLGNNNWLIRNTRGGKMQYANYHQYHNDFMKEIGQSHKIHDARKTAVSLMHSAGIPMETIRVIVGHSGKGVTEKVYLYKTPKELVEAINLMKIEK